MKNSLALEGLLLHVLGSAYLRVGLSSFVLDLEVYAQNKFVSSEMASRE